MTGWRPPPDSSWLQCSRWQRRARQATTARPKRTPLAAVRRRSRLPQQSRARTHRQGRSPRRRSSGARHRLRGRRHRRAGARQRRLRSAPRGAGSVARGSCSCRPARRATRPRWHGLEVIASTVVAGRLRRRVRGVAGASSRASATWSPTPTSAPSNAGAPTPRPRCRERARPTTTSPRWHRPGTRRSRSTTRRPTVDVAVPPRARAARRHRRRRRSAQQRVPLQADPSMVITVETPLDRRVPRHRLPRPRLDRRPGRGRGRPRCQVVDPTTDAAPTLAPMTTVAFGADHAGYELKQHLIARLSAAGLRHHRPRHALDRERRLPAVLRRRGAFGARRRCRLRHRGRRFRPGRAARRQQGARASARRSATACTRRAWRAQHNDANVLSIGARVVGSGLAEEIVDIFLTTDFEGGRHARRVAQITELEEQFSMTVSHRHRTRLRDRAAAGARGRASDDRPAADRQRELHVAGRAARHRLGAHEQVRRGLPGQALLRRQRQRRLDRGARHRARQGAVRAPSTPTSSRTRAPTPTCACTRRC